VAGLPSATADGTEAPILDLLVATGLARSRGEARRTIAEGGAYVNNQRVADPARVADGSDFLHGRWLLLRRGKRNVAAVERVIGPRP
jgi:tyrosyl-tRNA synthetase